MTNKSAFLRAAVIGCTFTLFVSALGACGGAADSGDDGGDPPGDGGGGGDGDVTQPPTPTTFTVALDATGATGVERVNFAIPLSRGALTDESAIRIVAGTTELPAARRVLARHGDGSARSVQVQVDVTAGSVQELTVELDVAGQAGVEMMPVASTLTGTGNAVRPRVWVRLPPTVLAASGVVGPVIPHADYAGTALDAWGTVCDYDRWDTDAFLVNAGTSRDVWLFDRVTAMYRGYAITGEQSPLASAYREATLYRDGMTIVNGVTTAIPIPTASTDLKYHYSQGLAIHYLLTGDDRFREAAEAVSARVVGMWDPNYDGTDEFWTERHAGFALLAHEWAMLVTDDKAAEIGPRADAAATAYLAAQMAPNMGQTDPTARCFAHTATAHGEGYGGTGCSPWMSAIVADALDAHGRRVGGAREVAVKESLGKLARAIAREGRDTNGRPLYWMGTGVSADEIDDYEEHWGESAYVVALGWAATGRTDAELRTAADALVDGLAAHGVAGQVRSFNWQCRSSVMTPALLK